MAREPTVRPPVSGPGSDVERWRAHAAAITETPLESWGELSRKAIMAALDGEGVPAPDEQKTAAETAPAHNPDAPGPADDEAAPLSVGRVRRPQWMVPTEDGPVAESEYTRRGR